MSFTVFFCRVELGASCDIESTCTPTAIGTVVPASDDDRLLWSSRWDENWQGNPKYSEKTIQDRFIHHKARMDLACLLAIIKG
jgi:hypothetical protein